MLPEAVPSFLRQRQDNGTLIDGKYLGLAVLGLPPCGLIVLAARATSNDASSARPALATVSGWTLLSRILGLIRDRYAGSLFGGL